MQHPSSHTDQIKSKTDKMQFSTSPPSSQNITMYMKLKTVHFFRLSTISRAWLAERSVNQLSPRSTIISLVWISLPGIKATDPNGTWWQNYFFLKFIIVDIIFAWHSVVIVNVTSVLKSFNPINTLRSLRAAEKMNVSSMNGLIHTLWKAWANQKIK